MTNKSFRYLKLYNGYQRGSIFSGFSEPGNWGLEEINPSLFEMEKGDTIHIPIKINRDRFPGAIDLVIENLPPGVTYTFNPVSLNSSDTSTVLSLTVADSVEEGSVLNFIISGIPVPVKNIQLGIKIKSTPHFKFGVPLVTSLRESS